MDQISQVLGSVAAPIETGVRDAGQFISGLVPPANAGATAPTAGAGPANPTSPAPASNLVNVADTTTAANQLGVPPAELSGSTYAAPNPTGAAPTAAPASNWASLGNVLKTGGNALEMYRRYELQQNLQNPDWIAAQIAKLRRPLSAALKQRVGSGVQAQMQEAGLGEAPGLFRQALAEALAPYQVQSAQDAQQAFEASIGASEGAYPIGGGLNDFGTLLNQVYQGGQ